MLKHLPARIHKILAIFNVCSKLQTYLLFVVPLCIVLWGSLHAEFLFKGEHLLLDYSECDAQALKDEYVIADLMEIALKAAGCTILCADFYHFEPYGMTAVFLLSESHASIHTYPEFNACFIDLFSCGSKNNFKAFHEIMKNYLDPKKVSIEFMTRDQNIKRRELR